MEASSACDMNCTYCFYRDVARNRENAFEGMLSLEAMERLVRAAMDYAEGTCTFAFQGGEPTLAGLDFYREVLALQKRYAKPGTAVRNTIQTNGYRIDAEWARFFAQERFLVGLSLDGPADLHNLNRRDGQGKGTFNRVLRAAKLFDKHGVEYNVLCVLTGKNARSIGQIYSFYKKQGFRWLQFIPCLEPLGVYPCDFYVLDRWRLGTVGEASFAQMLESEAARQFVEASLAVPEECGGCPAYFLCRNGCRRTRLVRPDGAVGLSRYCGAYRRFFAERGEALLRAAELLR